MIAPLLLAVLLQDPAIESAAPLAGAAQTGCWFPLVVKLSSAAGFEGDLAVVADTGYSVTRPVRVVPGATLRVLLPAVVLFGDAKVVVTLSRGDAEVARRPLDGKFEMLSDRERLVLVDPAHPDAEALHGKSIPTPGGRFAWRPFKADPALWEEASELGALEAVDGVLPAPAARAGLGLRTWRAMGGSVLADLRSEIRPARRFPSRDERASPLLGTSEWIGAKRNSALLFGVVYAFSLLVAGFTTASRKLGIRGLVLGFAGVSLAFVAAWALLFPKGDLAVSARQAYVESADGAAIVTLHQATAPLKAGREFTFAGLAKPVTGRNGLRAASLDVRLAGGGSRIRVSGPLDDLFFLTVAPSAPAPSAKTIPFPRFVNEYFNRADRPSTVTALETTSAAPLSLSSKDLVQAEVITVLRIKEAP